MPYLPNSSTRRRPQTRRTQYSGNGAYRKAPVKRRRTYDGKGAYTLDNPGPFGKAGRFIGGALGNAAYGQPGQMLGSKAGLYLGHKVGKLFGSGSYTYDGSGTSVLAPDVPKFAVRDDYVTIAHREYLGDIITSATAGAFRIDSFDLNPASSNTFPWLSNIAGPNYQQYKFDGCIFEFRSFSADALNSTNTALGSVSACINYDYSDSDPRSRYDIENTDWSGACKPSENMTIPVECKPSQTGMNGLLYVLNTPGLPPNVDPKTYFMGKLFIATSGFQGTSVNIGSLYVTYKVRLYKPLMSPPLSLAHLVFKTRVNPTPASPFGTALSTDETLYNCDTLGVDFPQSNTMRWNRKHLIVGQVFMVDFLWQGAVTADLSRPNFTLSANLEPLTLTDGGFAVTESAPFPNTNTGSSRIILSLAVRVTGNNIDATFVGTNTGLLPAGPAAAVKIRITQISSANPLTIGNVIIN